jgi:hypothetical protein
MDFGAIFLKKKGAFSSIKHMLNQGNILGSFGKLFPQNVGRNQIFV